MLLGLLRFHRLDRHRWHLPINYPVEPSFIRLFPKRTGNDEAGLAWMLFRQIRPSA